MLLFFSGELPGCKSSGWGGRDICGKQVKINSPQLVLQRFTHDPVGGILHHRVPSLVLWSRRRRALSRLLVKSQDRAARFTHHFFGQTAEQEVKQAGKPMGRHHQ